MNDSSWLSAEAEAEAAEAAERRNLQSGLNIAGGAIGLLSLFVGGLPVAFVGLMIGGFALLFAYLYVELVAKAVRMWVNRSLFGNHLGQIEPFRSGEEELASLGLVFKGLTVDITWEHVKIRDGLFGEKIVEVTSDPHSASGLMFPPNGKRFKVKILVPSLVGTRLTVELISTGGAIDTRLFSTVHEFISKEEGVRTLAVESKYSLSFSDEATQEEDHFEVNIVGAYKNESLDSKVELKVKVDSPGNNPGRASGVFVCDIQEP